MIRRRRLLKNDDGRGDKGIAELHVGRAIAVNMKQFDVFGEVGFHRGAVIDVHEFGGNEPDGQAAGCHPGIAEQQEMGIEPGQAADLEAEAIGDQRFEPLFVSPVQVMVPHIGRVRKDEVIMPIGGKPREVAGYESAGRMLPRGSSRRRRRADRSRPRKLGDRPGGKVWRRAE